MNSILDVSFANRACIPGVAPCALGTIFSGSRSTFPCACNTIPASNFCIVPDFPFDAVPHVLSFLPCELRSIHGCMLASLDSCDSASVPSGVGVLQRFRQGVPFFREATR